MSALGSVRSVLVLDADKASVEVLRGKAAAFGALRFDASGCPRKARSMVKLSPDLVLLEAELPDGASIEMLRMLRNVGRPRAVFVMSKQRDCAAVTELLSEGADDWLEKPVAIDDLSRALESLDAADRRFEQLARWSVGRMGLRDALEGFRMAMQKEAMRRTQGSARGTAALLDVDRHYIQRVFRKLGVGPAPNDVAPAMRRSQVGWSPAGLPPEGEA